MYIETVKRILKGKTYAYTLLRNSFRDPITKKPTHKTLLNITDWPKEKIEGLRMVIEGKSLPSLASNSQDSILLQQGKKIGGLWVIAEIAKKLGLEKILGKTRQSKIAMLLIAGRILTQGSRFHLLEWSAGQEIEEVFGLKDINKDELYRTLDWLAEHQSEIEKKLFLANSKSSEIQSLFLYDVTSSYLEGEQNELGAYGYNRDKKNGKQQIVIGLLTNHDGLPVSVSVFEGNTSDTKTVQDQIETLTKQFKVQNVVMVGDRGMIKTPQKTALNDVNFQYITAMTKKQIEVLLREDIIQLGLFDSEIVEISRDNKRYILKRNPVRQEEIRAKRTSKLEILKKLALSSTEYLSVHAKSNPDIYLERLNKKILRYGLQSACQAKLTDRTLELEIITDNLDNLGMLDGCYVLETDVPSENLDAKSVHARYKDLALVESAFRTMKTTCLEVRPVFVRKESRTRGHVFVTMLAYLVTQQLWKMIEESPVKINMTRAQILERLDSIQTVTYIANGISIKKVPSPEPSIQAVLDSLNIAIPPVL